MAIPIDDGPWGHGKTKLKYGAGTRVKSGKGKGYQDALLLMYQVNVRYTVYIYTGINVYNC